MLDIKYIRENPEAVKENMKKKLRSDISLVDDILKKDEEYRKILGTAQELRAKRNKLSQSINQTKKEGGDIAPILAEVKDIPNQIKKIEDDAQPLADEIQQLQMKIPNIMHESVPIGKDDTENVEDQRFGEPVSKEVKPHGEIMEKMNIADFEAARRTSGKGFHFLKGGLAQLDNALLQFAIDFMNKKGYTMVTPPNLISNEVVNGVMTFSEKEEMIFSIEGENLNLIGTAEHSLIGMFKDTVVQEKALPIKLFGSSACYRKEIGSHGVDEKGTFRVHQFNKVEQIIICKPEDSMKMYNELLQNSIDILKELEVPFRTLKICSGDLGDLKHIQHDIELWSPRKNDWIETMSCSNLTDGQALLLNIKAEGGKGRYHVHTLNDTAMATSRMLTAIVENFYDEKTKSIYVPKKLRPYMNGKEKIEIEPKWFI